MNTFFHAVRRLPATALLAVGLGMLTPAAHAATDVPLQPNQREQGYIEADTGSGKLRYRAVATRMADDLGKQASEKLNTAQGKDVVQRSGVAASEVQETANFFAGKTLHEADVRHVPMIKRYIVSLQGRAADGSQVRINLQLAESDFSLQDASVDYLPYGLKKPFESYSSTNGSPARVNIERFEKVDDKIFRVAGTFRAENMGTSQLSKELKGKTLPLAEGRFEFTELPLKAMPTFGARK